MLYTYERVRDIGACLINRFGGGNFARGVAAADVADAMI